MHLAARADLPGDATETVCPGRSPGPATRISSRRTGIRRNRQGKKLLRRIVNTRSKGSANGLDGSLDSGARCGVGASYGRRRGPRPYCWRDLRLVLVERPPPYEQWHRACISDGCCLRPGRHRTGARTSTSRRTAHSFQTGPDDRALHGTGPDVPGLSALRVRSHTRHSKRRDNAHPR